MRATRGNKKGRNIWDVPALGLLRRRVNVLIDKGLLLANLGGEEGRGKSISGVFDEKGADAN